MGSIWGTGGTGGSPCGACKFLRRKCSADCIFAPYFWSDQLGTARFAAIHKVFGASNVSKLLLHIPAHHRCEAVLTIAYQAEARIKDPVYGCLPHIFALQHQVAYLQAQVMQVKAQLAHRLMSRSEYKHDDDHHRNDEINIGEKWWMERMNMVSSPPDHHHELEPHYPPDHGFIMQSSSAACNYKKTVPLIHLQQQNTNNTTDLGDLQALALTMMRS